MRKRSSEISAWGIIIMFLGLFLYSQQNGLGLLVITLGAIKLFWDIVKNEKIIIEKV